MNPTSEELADVIIHRLGLHPRKTGATEKMHHVLIELYEKTKAASREKNPKYAIMSVEEMAAYAHIKRQTMYDYLKRWLALDLIKKTSLVDHTGNVTIGYQLNGNTLESAYEKARAKIINHLDFTHKYILELQRLLKNEKISGTFSEKEGKPLPIPDEKKNEP